MLPTYKIKKRSPKWGGDSISRAGRRKTEDTQESIMELNPGEVRIYYRTKVGDIDTELDEALGVVLEKFGYRRWASGFEIAIDVRNLVFGKKKN